MTSKTKMSRIALKLPCKTTTKTMLKKAKKRVTSRWLMASLPQMLNQILTAKKAMEVKKLQPITRSLLVKQMETKVPAKTRKIMLKWRSRAALERETQSAQIGSSSLRAKRMRTSKATMMTRAQKSLRTSKRRTKKRSKRKKAMATRVGRIRTVLAFCLANNLSAKQTSHRLRQKSLHTLPAKTPTKNPTKK